MLINIVLGLVIYFVSAVLTYVLIRYSFNTEFRGLSPGFVELIFVIVPFVNTIAALVYGFECASSYLEDKSHKKNSFFNKFFGIKR